MMIGFKYFFFSAFNFITTPPDRLYIFGIFKGIIHFLPQMADMDRYGIVALIVVFIAPYLMEQVFGTYNVSFIFT